jgi:hypothetical protein
LPKAIRNEAHRLLRHYPTLASIDLAALIDRRFACSYQLTADIDPEWWKNYRFGVHTELRSPGTPISRKPHPREAPAGKRAAPGRSIHDVRGAGDWSRYLRVSIDRGLLHA